MKVKKIPNKEEKSAEVRKLKARNRKLETENKRLVSEIRTLEAAFQKNLKFLKGSTEDVSVEDLIEAAKEDKSLKEVKDEVIKCPNCEAEIRPIATRFGKVIACKCGHRGKIYD